MKIQARVKHEAPWPWAKNHDVEVSVGEKGGCACSLLADEADWEAESWSMEPSMRDALAATLRTLVSHVPSGLVVEALWQGEKANETHDVTADQLDDLVRGSRLGTHASYRVHIEGAA